MRLVGGSRRPLLLTTASEVARRAQRRPHRLPQRAQTSSNMKLLSLPLRSQRAPSCIIWCGPGRIPASVGDPWVRFRATVWKPRTEPQSGPKSDRNTSPDLAAAAITTLASASAPPSAPPAKSPVLCLRCRPNSRHGPHIETSPVLSPSPSRNPRPNPDHNPAGPYLSLSHETKFAPTVYPACDQSRAQIHPRLGPYRGQASGSEMYCEGLTAGAADPEGERRRRRRRRRRR